MDYIILIFSFMCRYFQNCVDYSSYSLKYSLTQGWHEVNRRNLDWFPLKNLSKLTILYDIR